MPSNNSALMPKKVGAYATKKTSEPFRISDSMCTRTLRNLTRYRGRRNLTKHLLRQNVPEPHKVSAPEPSETSQGICPRTLRNFTTHLHPDASEPHQVAAPETSGTSPGTSTKNLLEPNQLSICTRTLRNLTRYLHRKSVELHRTFQSFRRNLHRNPPEPHELTAPEPAGTFRYLVLKLHRIAPELILHSLASMFCVSLWDFHF